MRETERQARRSCNAAVWSVGESASEKGLELLEEVERDLGESPGVELFASD